MKTTINFLTLLITVLAISSHVIAYAQSTVVGSKGVLPGNSPAGNTGNPDITTGSRHQNNANLPQNDPIDKKRRDEISSSDKKNTDTYRAQPKLAPQNQPLRREGMTAGGPSQPGADIH